MSKYFSCPPVSIKGAGKQPKAGNGTGTGTGTGNGNENGQAGRLVDRQTELATQWQQVAVASCIAAVVAAAAWGNLAANSAACAALATAFYQHLPFHFHSLAQNFN